MILTKIAQYVSDLGFDNIILGRLNYNNIDFNNDLIVVDTLAINMLGSSDAYDGDTEVIAYATKYKGVFTVNFYGDNADTNASDFINKCRSQSGYDSEVSNGITVYKPTTITDLRTQEGTQYFNRYEVELTVMYFISTDIDTLRIDTANVEIINDK